jgi:hypothetical protein
MDVNAMYSEELSRAYRKDRLAEAAHERRLNEASSRSRTNARSNGQAGERSGRTGLLRAFSKIGSRRAVLTRMSAAGLVALVASLPSSAGFGHAANELATDGKKRKKKRCKKKRRCGKKRCCKRGRVCVGGACTKKEDPGQGTCPAGADSCLAGLPILCNGDSCLCVSSTEGDTRCAQAGLAGKCGACTSSADCAALGADAFCFVAGPGCGCVAGEGQCTLPCAG